MDANTLKNEIISFLDDATYQYALLIDGEWGSGKTYFMKNIVIPELTVNHSIVYVSLFSCNTVLDIQEAIICELGEKVLSLQNKNGIDKSKADILNNVYMTTKRIAEGIKKYAFPQGDIELRDIIANWLLLKEYVFVFDDIERCNCPFNELFGFINNLVEHEGSKVILVANEKEMLKNIDAGEKALQYISILTEVRANICEESVNQQSKGNKVTSKEKMTLQDLENRRKQLYPESLRGDYKRIKEKIVGVTLHFEPDIKNTICSMLEKCVMDDKHKLCIKSNLNILTNMLKEKRHMNLRSFQFFISKSERLLKVLEDMKIDAEIVRDVNKKVLLDCLETVITEKKGEQKNDDREEYNPSEREFISITTWINSGEFNAEKFKQEIRTYIKITYTDNISQDDPLMKLYYRWNEYTMIECQDILKAMIVRVKKNIYPIEYYWKILYIFQILVEEVGIETDFSIENLVELLKDCITRMDGDDLVPINRNTIFIDNEKYAKEIKDRVIGINNTINDTITKRTNNTIESLLDEGGWGEKLEKFVRERKGSIDDCVFSTVDKEKWIRVLKNAKPSDIQDFRKAISILYPSDGRRYIENYDDIQLLGEVADSIELDSIQDSIVKYNLKWFRNQTQKLKEEYLVDVINT